MNVSPSESPAFRALGRSTWRTEEFGVDAMWVARGKTYGVQRKALTDLIASVDDGRLAKETMQMRGLDVPILILETGMRGGGRPSEMPDGKIAATAKWGRGWTGKQLRGVLWSVADEGVRIECVKDEQETIARVLEIVEWSKKSSHASTSQRGSAPGNVWGKRGSREYGVWMLMGLPGVGVEMAGRLWDAFAGVGGVITLNEKVGGVKGLTSVKGVGKVTAQRIVRILGTDGEIEDD